MGRKKYDMINEVIAHFDFERVKQTMDALNWTWCGSEETPTIQELKEAAQERLNNAIDGVLSKKAKDLHHDVGWQSSSGGFKATAWKTKKGKLDFIKLEFIVSEWDAENESPKG